MPRYVLSRETDVAKYASLVKRLKEELESSLGEQPLILEERIEITGSRHIHVIWDRWSGVPDESRSAVILQAYRDIESDTANDITIAIGVTPREAVELGLLPFVVQPMRKISEQISLEDYGRIEAEEAAHTILGADAKELRYATLEAAELACQRLQCRLPGSHWAVVKEVAQAV